MASEIDIRNVYPYRTDIIIVIMKTNELLSRAAKEIVRHRWERTSKAERSEVAQALNQSRWEKWRAENPEKAAASEARRAKRAKAGKKSTRKAG